MIDISKFERGSVSPPGETVVGLLSQKGISLESFVDQLSVSRGFVDGLVSGDTPLTDCLAEKLSSVLGGSVTFWLNRERKYREFISELNASYSENDDCWLSSIPVSSMQSYGWIPMSKSKIVNLVNCLNFFDSDTVDQWRSMYEAASIGAKFRTSNSFSPEVGAVSAWIKQGETEAEFMPCGVWDREKMLHAIPEILKLTLEPAPTVFLPKLQEICAEAGVAVVVARTPRGCQASGATKFLSSEKALLMLSFRYMADDQFWFSVFHEIGHLVLHGSEGVFIEGDGFCNDKQESEANKFAQDLIVPPEFEHMLKSLVDYRKIIKFSRSLGVAPGLIVGQLQHRGIIRHNHMQKLKVRYRWS